MAPQTDLTAAPSQSPIDLDSAVPDDCGSLSFGYDDQTMTCRDTGMTLEFTVPEGNSIEYHTRRYELAQFHFHTPSEHAIDGEHADLEIHLVHEDPQGSLCVIAVFGEESEMARWPDRLTAPLRLDWLLPRKDMRYMYSGSLTTPPYTERVEWIVLTERIKVNPEWVEQFRTCYGSNHRPLQPLNGRTVTMFAGASSCLIRHDTD